MQEQAAQPFEASEQLQAAHDEREDDDGPMVYTTPNDYASWAHKHREELLSQGEEVVLMSEVFNQPRKEGESDADFAKRISDDMNDKIRRGVQILNDQTTHDVVPDGFHVDGHDFNVGPSSGITKKEYREFTGLFDKEDLSYADIPDRFLKFEKSQAAVEESSEL